MEYRTKIRLRMSAKDAHYGGNLVDGAHMVHLFGDVATELLIMRDGDEGLFCAYDMIEFKAPVYAGDFIEAEGMRRVLNPPCPLCKGGRAKRRGTWTQNMRPVGFPLLRGCPKGGGFEDPNKNL